MGRLIQITALGVALIVTLSCGDKKNSYPLIKADARGGADFVRKTEAINKALGNGPCFRIDILTSEWVKLENDSILIYSTDLRTGEVIPDAEWPLRIFKEDSDSQLHAQVFFKKPIEFIVQSLAAKDLHSGMGYLLSPSIVDEKCESVKFKNHPDADFTIVRKSERSLWLQNKRKPTEILFYQYDGKGKLSVDVINEETGSYCGKTPSAVMRSYVVTRQESGKFTLNYDFASIIASYTEEPQELTRALADQSPTKRREAVEITKGTLEAIQQSIARGEVVAPVCE